MKNRNPFVVVILSVITLGIYDLYWLVKTKKELNEKTSHHIPTIWLIIVPLLVVIAGYVLVFALGGHHTNTTNYYDDDSTNNSNVNGNFIIGFLVILLGFFLTFIMAGYWTFKYSKAVDEYTNGKMNTGVAFLMLWLVHLIGVAIIQDTFNDMNRVNTSTGTPPAPPTPQIR